MAFAIGGVGSGLDVDNIVRQLMVLERRPLDALESRERDYRNDLSAFGRLKGALSSFESAMDGLASLDKFKVFSATSANEDAFTATASTSATTGSYAVKVNQLAQSHKLASAAFASTDAIGTGTLSIQVGTNSFNVAIDGTNNTLSDIRDAINNAADNTGVSASIITDDTGSRLILSSDKSGTANAITVTATDDDANNIDNAGLSQLVYDGVNNNLSLGQAARDSIIEIDGFTVTNSSNTVTGAVEGVTLNLKAQTTAADALSVSRDTAAVKENVQAFVDAYNSLRSTIRTLGGEDGPLQGDSGLLSIERQIQNVFNTKASGLDFDYLSELGVTTAATGGSLEIDSAKLDEALSTNFTGVANFFADATQGFAVKMGSTAESLLAADGLIKARETGINSSIKGLESRQESLEYRMELIEKRFRSQFTALDSLIVQLQSSGNFLSQQLANLPGPRTS